MKCSLKVFFFLLLVFLLPPLSLFLYIFGMSREWSLAKQKICRRRFHVRDGASRGWGCRDKKRWQSRLEVAATHKDGFYATNSPGRSHIVAWRGAASEILPVSRRRTVWRGEREAFDETGSCFCSHWITLFIRTLGRFLKILRRTDLSCWVQLSWCKKRKTRGLIRSPVGSLCCLVLTSLCCFLWPKCSDSFLFIQI